MTQPVLTVFGATGAQGGGLARAILADPARRFALRAVTRRPDSPRARALAAAGADIVAADLDEPASLGRALRGSHGAWCVTGFGEHGSPARTLAQAEAIASAASTAAVRHLIWSTFEDTREFSVPGTTMPLLGGHYNVPQFDAKGEANRCFVARELPVTLLYTSLHWDELLHPGRYLRRAGDGTLEFLLPMPGGVLLPGIAAEDVGACALAIFARGPELAGKSIGIAGEHPSGTQMAAQLALALGEPVRHRALAPQDYAALDVPGADQLANMFRFKTEFERAYCGARDPARTRELHPGLLDFAGWLACHRSKLLLQKAAA
jgi:uncharacterized protein YbjT (DUF2867 family)